MCMGDLLTVKSPSDLQSPTTSVPFVLDELNKFSSLHINDIFLKIGIILEHIIRHLTYIRFY